MFGRLRLVLGYIIIQHYQFLRAKRKHGSWQEYVRHKFCTAAETKKAACFPILLYTETALQTNRKPQQRNQELHASEMLVASSTAVLLYPQPQQNNSAPTCLCFAHAHFISARRWLARDGRRRAGSALHARRDIGQRLLRARGRLGGVPGAIPFVVTVG